MNSISFIFLLLQVNGRSPILYPFHFVMIYLGTKDPTVMIAYDLSLALPTRSYSSQGLYGSVELELCCRKDGGRAKPKLIKL